MTNNMATVSAIYLLFYLMTQTRKLKFADKQQHCSCTSISDYFSV